MRCPPSSRLRAWTVLDEVLALYADVTKVGWPVSSWAAALIAELAEEDSWEVALLLGNW